jgi:integrase
MFFHDTRHPKAMGSADIEAIRARQPTRVPTVLTTEGALQLMGSVSGTHELMAKGLYGTGRRRMECLRLRVPALDGAPQQIVVRDGNGMEDRVTMRPESLIIPLQEHGARVQRVHAPDVAHGYGAVL